MAQGIERNTGGRCVGGIEMLTGLENARLATVQHDLHLAPQNEHPLGCGGAVKFALKPHGTVAQLVTRTWHQ